jgi:hypothetical protein
MLRLVIPFLCALTTAAQPKPPLGYKVEQFSNGSMATNIAAFSIDENGRFYVVESFRQPHASTNRTAGSIEERVELLRKELGTKFSSLTNATERIRLLEDRNHDGKADFNKVFAEGFNRPFDGVARSILAHEGDVYFTCSPDLWLLKEGSRQSLHAGFGAQIGNPEHDLRGLTMGPDGRIYFAMGDRGLNVVTREGAPLVLPDEGAVLRCELDGSNLEIIARGFRNPRGLAFNEVGDLFAVDGKRLLYVIEGANYGLTNLPAITNFSAEATCLAYADKFLVGFSNGISAATLRQSGAAYRCSSVAMFVSNAAPTDIQLGPQTGFYFSEKNGSIFRVFDPVTKEKQKPVVADDPGKLAAILLNKPTVEALWAEARLARKGNLLAQQALVLAGRSKDAEIRAQAARALGEVPVEQSGAALATLLGDVSPRVRLFAALSFRRLKYAPVQQALFDMMKDPDPWLAFAARESLTVMVRKN